MGPCDFITSIYLTLLWLLHHLHHHWPNELWWHWLRLSCILTFCWMSCCDSDIVQHGGNVGQEACGPERHPGERGGLPQRAGDPANGKHINSYCIAQKQYAGPHNSSILHSYKWTQNLILPVSKLRLSSHSLLLSGLTHTAKPEKPCWYDYVIPFNFFSLPLSPHLSEQLGMLVSCSLKEEGEPTSRPNIIFIKLFCAICPSCSAFVIMFRQHYSHVHVFLTGLHCVLLFNFLV